MVVNLEIPGGGLVSKAGVSGGGDPRVAALGMTLFYIDRCWVRIVHNKGYSPMRDAKSDSWTLQPKIGNDLGDSSRLDHCCTFPIK